MSLTRAMDVAASVLSAQRLRMELAAANVANSKMMIEDRSKLLDAYREVIRMQL